jgi:hypothetical protein
MVVHRTPLGAIRRDALVRALVKGVVGRAVAGDAHRACPVCGEVVQGWATQRSVLRYHMNGAHTRIELENAYTAQLLGG